MDLVIISLIKGEKWNIFSYSLLYFSLNFITFFFIKYWYRYRNGIYRFFLKWLSVLYRYQKPISDPMCAQSLGNPMIHCWDVSSVLSNSTHFDLWPLRNRPGSCAWHANSSWWTCVPSNFGILWCMVEMRTGKGSPIKQYSFWPLTSKCDFAIWGIGLGLERDMPPHHGESLCHVSWKSYDEWLRCGPDKVQSYQTVLI